MMRLPYYMSSSVKSILEILEWWSGTHMYSKLWWYSTIWNININNNYSVAYTHTMTKPKFNSGYGTLILILRIALNINKYHVAGETVLKYCTSWLIFKLLMIPQVTSYLKRRINNKQHVRSGKEVNRVYICKKLHTLEMVWSLTNTCSVQISKCMSDGSVSPESFLC